MDPAFLEKAGVMVVAPSDGERYLVGEAARTQTQDVRYMTANSRYTSQDALIRFYAALGSLLPPGQTSTEVRLVVGTNVDAYRVLRDDLRTFFAQPHQFTTNQTSYRLTVSEVLVSNQPRGAIAYLMAHPPAALHHRLQKRALLKSTVIVVDIGNFTTDCIVLVPAKQPDGSIELEEVYDYSFALPFGVQQLRDEVTAIMQETRRDPTAPSLWEVDQALQTGLVNVDGDDRDIRPQIAQARDRLWRRVYESRIRPNFERIQPHYLLAVSGGVADATFGPAVQATWGHLPGFAVPDRHLPHEVVMRGYAELAVQRWGHAYATA
jgi:hypothetical protein